MRHVCVFVSSLAHAVTDGSRNRPPILFHILSSISRNRPRPTPLASLMTIIPYSSLRHLIRPFLLRKPIRRHLTPSLFLIRRIMHLDSCFLRSESRDSGERLEVLLVLFVSVLEQAVLAVHCVVGVLGGFADRFQGFG